MKRYAHIIGWGKYAPENVLTNDDLSRMVDTSDEWIRTRTGIQTRHIVGEGETTATMGLRAAQAALEVANVTPDQIDLIIVATASPDYPTPATACLVQDALGATRAGAFDLAAGCSGFVYGLSVASGLIEAGTYDTILVIGAETISHAIDWSDRGTCVLFGDGAGAVVLQASESPGGVLASVMGADGSGAELLYVPAGGCRRPTSADTVAQGLHFLRMEGRPVFRFAVNIMPRASRLVCERAGLSLDDIELFIPHQANERIIQASARALKIPAERMFTNLEHYGNTSAASIPIALCEAVEAGPCSGVCPGLCPLAPGGGRRCAGCITAGRACARGRCAPCAAWIPRFANHSATMPRMEISNHTRRIRRNECRFRVSRTGVPIRRYGARPVRDLPGGAPCVR